jgi:hypothetical protein
MNLFHRTKALMGGRMLSDIRGTMVIALFGRVCHFFAFVYAARCLGDGLGESTEALGWAQYLQFVLTLGLDIVAVRHLAAKTISFDQLVPSVFTSRLLIYGFCSLVWVFGLLCLKLPWHVFQLWLAAVLNLFTLGMSFQWVFQGKERMPAFTLIQALISACILCCFLVGFSVGDSPQLSRNDVRFPNEIASQLRESIRPVDQWLLDQLSDETKITLNVRNEAAFDEDQFTNAVINDLNRIIQGDLIDSGNLEGIQLDPVINEMLFQQPVGMQVQKLNRQILEEVFGDKISKINLGTKAGADLWVMGICQLLVTTGAWIYIKIYYRVSLYAKRKWRDIGVYINEGLPNWIFGLLYNTLITVGMLSLKRLSAGNAQFANHDDAYATLYRLALAVHFILAFIGSVIYTRIVIWKNERNDFVFRVALVCSGVIVCGVLSCSVIHWVHPVLYPFLFQKEVFLPAAPYMSLMLLGRFVGLTSGILVWGMLAYHRDWRAVYCAIIPVSGSVLLHFLLVPQYGMHAAVLLNLGGELGLFFFCLIGFVGLRKSVQFRRK